MYESYKFTVIDMAIVLRVIGLEKGRVYEHWAAT